MQLAIGCDGGRAVVEDDHKGSIHGGIVLVSGIFAAGRRLGLIAYTLAVRAGLLAPNPLLVKPWAAADFVLMATMGPVIQVGRLFRV